MLCGWKTKTSAHGRYDLHGNACRASQHLNEPGFSSATLVPPPLKIFQGVSGDHVDVDEAYRAELDFMEKSENSGTRAGGQFSANARKYERALNSIEEDWARDAYEKTQIMTYLDVRQRW